MEEMQNNLKSDPNLLYNHKNPISQILREQKIPRHVPTTVRVFKNSRL